MTPTEQKWWSAGGGTVMRDMVGRAFFLWIVGNCHVS